MKTRKITIALILGIMLIVGTSCGPKSIEPSDGNDNSGNSVSEEVKAFDIVMGTEPTTLDPQFVTDVNTARSIMQIYENLVSWDDDYNIVGDLAESWTTSEDGLTWTFTLKQDVKFHDGTPFNAEAVKFTYERFIDPATASPRASQADMIDNIEILGEHEVAITTKAPTGDFLASMTSYNFCIISPEAVKKHGKDYNINPAGTGALKLKEWNFGESLVLEKFEDYWGEKATTDIVKISIVPEDASRVMMLQSGDADIAAGVPPIQMEKLQEDPNINIITETGYRTIFMGMNFKHEPFDDLRVRQAINHAIDKQSIIDNILGGMATAPVGVESIVISNAATDLEPYEYNPEKAKKLLAEAGYPDGFKTTIHTPEGRYAMDRQISEVVQAQLLEVGIDSEIIILDWGAYQEATTGGETTNLFLLGKGSPTGDPYMTQQLSFTTGAGMNNSFYSNPTFDRLVDKIRVEVDQDKRADMLYEAQKIIHEDAVYAVLYYETQTMATRSNVKGFEIYPNEMFKLWYLERE